MQVTTNDTYFELAEDESLLEGLERTGHQVEFQCRKGYCGTCRVTVVSGEVEYFETPLSCVGKNEVLPCCCRAKSNLSLKVNLLKKVKIA